MSLSGALSSAISALNAQSTSLAMVGDNIANADTVGYKTTSASFEDLVTASSTSGAYSSGGVNVLGIANITQQGLLAATTTSTNVAIQGSGFFVTTNALSGGTTSYTRNGAFAPDNNGFLVDNGSYLEGYRTDSSGNITGTGLGPVNTEVAQSNGGATTESAITANLPANAVANISTTTTPTDGSSFGSTMTVYDSLGEAHSLNVTWTKSATPDNTWTASFAAANASDVAATNGLSVNGGSPTYTVTFNSDGSLGSVAPTNATSGAVDPLNVSWTDGATTSAIALNFGTPGGGTDGVTQLASGDTTPAVTNFNAISDGSPMGTLTGVSVAQGGVVEATYSNGKTVPIYKLAVATFTDPNGLVAQSDGLYTATATSGDATLQTSGQGSAGTVFGSELESSTTDTTGQFSNMISAQQAYSAASQVVTTVNKMFDTLISSMR